MNCVSPAPARLPLALGLSSPWMLLGLLLAAIPVLIHLFYRRRYEEVRWGAVLFLSKAVRRNAQRNRFQQLLLLILRTLAIVVLVIGFARPLVDSSMADTLEEQPTFYLFVLDDSLSMRATTDGLPCFDRAKEIMQEIVEAARPDDQFQILRTSGLASGPLLSGDRAFVRGEIGTLACTARSTEAGAAIALAETVLSRLDNGSIRRVYVLSDFAASDWGAADANAQAGLARLDRHSDVTLINVAGRDSGNVAVTAPLSAAVALVGQRLRIEGVLSNHGPEPITRTVRFSANDRLVGTRTVEVAAGREAPFRFDLSPSHAGAHRLLIETENDNLDDDNRFRLVINAFEQVPVLLVNGRPSAEPLGNASDFLRLSLAPGDDPAWQSPWSVEVVTEAEFSSIDLAEYGIVFVCDVRQFTKQEALKLKQYTQSGGAVVLCPGDRADIGNYNSRVLGNDGLLRVRLDRFIGNAVNPTVSLSFDTNKLSHPILSVYRGNPGHGLEQALNFRYLRAVSDGQQTRTALALENGDPVILEGPCASGRVAIVTISADRARWSTWNTGSGTYATLMNELCQFMLESTNASPPEFVGEPWSRRFPGTVRQATVTTSKGEVLPASTNLTETGLTVEVDAIEEPSFVRVGSLETTQHVAINVPTSESDLRPASEADLREGFGGEGAIPLVTANNFSLDPVASQSSHHRVSLWLFLFVAGLLFAEQVLASRANRTTWVVAVSVSVAAVVLLNLPLLHGLIVLSAVGAASVAVWRWIGRRGAIPGQRV